jgi:hypothetical protein
VSLFGPLFAALTPPTSATWLSATWVRVASIPDVVALKELAGRPQDAVDIAELRAIAARRERRP